MKFYWWRLCVCWYGWTWHDKWVWGDIDESEWREGFENEPCAEDFYIEGWCRQ